jgi:hypothetical protein
MVFFVSVSGKDLSYLIFVCWLSCFVKLKFKLGSAHAKDFKPIAFGNKFGARTRVMFWVSLIAKLTPDVAIENPK